MEHIWDKYDLKYSSEYVYEDGVTYKMSFTGTEQVARTVSVNKSTGALSYEGQRSMTATEYAESGYKDYKYIYLNSAWRRIYAGPEKNNFVSYPYYYIWTAECRSKVTQVVSGKNEIVGEVISVDSMAYPEDGVKDGNWYVKRNELG